MNNDRSPDRPPSDGRDIKHGETPAPPFKIPPPPPPPPPPEE